MSLTLRAKTLVPMPLWKVLKFGKRTGIRAVQNSLALVGLNVSRRSDYYSPLPDPAELARTESQWNKPSALKGVRYDLNAFERTLGELTRWFPELAELTDYATAREAGFGPGYPEVDAAVLYAMVRELKPARYLEVGSGLSTYYASLAAGRNKAEGRPLEIQCIEPYPYELLRSIPGINVNARKVQDIPVAEFELLAAGDILFIDSSHALKIGSDVAYLLLEVLPALAPGVFIHIHDIHFPYNIPFPAAFWVRDRNWPIYWNEAMAVQAFLAFNQRFEIHLSLPLLRHFERTGLERLLPGFAVEPIGDAAFSSLWLRS
jgi:hypothetical protein